MQVPAALLHDLHWPVQAESQQTPSAQNPVTHSGPKPQLWPCFFLHWPAPSQARFPSHVTVELVSGVFAGTLLVQVPAAFAHDLHWVPQSDTQQVPSMHLPDAHSVESTQAWPGSLVQLPAPSQELLPLHKGLLLASGWYCATFVVQVPLTLAQEWQGVVQLSTQQVLSMQLPLAQSAAPPQV